MRIGKWTRFVVEMDIEAAFGIGLGVAVVDYRRPWEPVMEIHFGWQIFRMGWVPNYLG